MRRILTGLGATALLLLLLVGLPALLVLIAPVGLPHVLLTPAGIWAALWRPDDGTLFLTLIKIVGWITWAILVVSIAAEAIGRLRHLRPPALPGLALPQGIARGLIAASLTLFVNANTAIGPNTAAPAQAAPLTPAPTAAPLEDHAQTGHRYDDYTVRKGDTLSQIALDHLGNAHRYPAIYKASRGIHQRGGQRLNDPDVIDIGWTLHIPTAHTKPDHRPSKQDQRHTGKPTATVPTALPPPSTPPASPPPSTPPTTDSAQSHREPAPTAPSTQDEAASEQPRWLLTGLAGAGAILAGSLWLVVLRRRAVQQHHRRHGFVTAPPPPRTIPVEKTLRYQGGPVSEVLIFIDEALRRLATTIATPLPVVRAVAATPRSVRLHLAQDATLPEPWQQAGAATVWSLDIDDVPTDSEPLEPDGPAPWPHLATIGADDTGRWWLLNLETAGTTTIAGDPDYADDLGRYLAAELATSPWSRDVQVDLIDAYPELADLDPTRLRHYPNPDDTVAAAVETIDRLNRLHLTDLPAARATQAGDEIWLNRVVVTTSPADHLGPLERLTNDQPGRTGVAIVQVGTTDTGSTTLAVTVGSDGRVRIPALDLDLVANGLTTEEARGCVQLLQAAESRDNADLPRAGDDGWRQHTDQAGRLNTDLTEPRDPDGADDPNLTNLPQPDEVILEQSATTGEDLQVLAPVVPQTTRAQVEADDPTLDVDLADWFSDTCTRPRLSVLGPMRVRVGPGGNPTEAAKRKPYYTEIVAHLATRPAGATSVQLCAAFAVTPARLQRDLVVVRKWLGTDPATGERYLPDATRSSLIHDGHGVYQLHDLLYDADLFRRLRLRGQTRGTAGLEDYLRALSLVTGTPYARLHDGGGIWLADNRDDQHLTVAIVDTAHLAVTMALQLPDPKLARLAAEVAATAAPNEETPKLDLAAIADAEGDTARAGRAITDLLRQRDADGPIEPDPRTAGLFVSKGWTSTTRTGQRPRPGDAQPTSRRLV
jgi:hypothetical protein